jgi:hypothetical protein
MRRSSGSATCNLLSKVIQFAYMIIKSNKARSAWWANGILICESICKY